MGVDDYVAAEEVAVAEDELGWGVLVGLRRGRDEELGTYRVVAETGAVGKLFYCSFELFLEACLALLRGVCVDWEGENPFLHDGPDVRGRFAGSYGIDGFRRRNRFRV